MKRFVLFVVLAVALVLGLLVATADFGDGERWTGWYVVGEVGGAAPQLDLPLVRGDGRVPAWGRGPEHDEAACAVALWVETGDDAVEELFVPHVEALVDAVPDLRVVWISAHADDAWLPADAPGLVAHDPGGRSHEAFGGARLPFGALVSPLGELVRTGFPTEIDEEAVRRAADDDQRRRSRRRWSRSLNVIEPLVYRDGAEEKVAVRVIPPDLADADVETRFRSSRSRVWYSLVGSLAGVLEEVERSAEVDTSALPAELTDTLVKVDVWAAGLPDAHDDGRDVALRTAFEAALEAFELRAVHRTGDDGRDVIVLEALD